MTDPTEITRKSDIGCWFGAMLIVLGIVVVGFVVLCWMTGPGRADEGSGPGFDTGCAMFDVRSEKSWPGPHSSRCVSFHAAASDPESTTPESPPQWGTA